MNNPEDHKVLQSNKATNRNIMAIKQHSDITRQQVNELRDVVDGYVSTIQTLHQTITGLQGQIQQLQIKLYTGGTTDGNNN